MGRLSSLIMVTVFLLTSTVSQAVTPWPNAYRFFGRWDLRTVGRAVTVNSGSYVRARFSGAGLRAFFDVSVNEPHCVCTLQGSYPTIAWRVDEGKWREAEVAPTVRLADGLARGRHTVMLMVRGLDERQRRSVRR